MIKLVVSDVDYTLVRDKMSIELMEAIKAANEAGIEFVLCSGRPTINLRSLAKELNDFGATINHVAGFNGGEIVDVQNDQVVYSKGFSNTEIDQITNDLKQLGINYGLYQDDKLVVDDRSNEYAIHEMELTDLKFADHEQSIGSIKILGFSDPEDTLANIEKIQAIYPDLQINRSKPFFIEITKPGVNKGLAVTEMSSILNVELADVAVCGDGDNDIAMYELNVGRKYVVANGSENLKQYADKILASVDDNGVGRELMELIKQ